MTEEARKLKPHDIVFGGSSSGRESNREGSEESLTDIIDTRDLKNLILASAPRRNSVISDVLLFYLVMKKIEEDSRKAAVQAAMAELEKKYKEREIDSLMNKIYEGIATIAKYYFMSKMETARRPEIDIEYRSSSNGSSEG